MTYLPKTRENITNVFQNSLSTSPLPPSLPQSTPAPDLEQHQPAPHIIFYSRRNFMTSLGPYVLKNFFAISFKKKSFFLKFNVNSNFATYNDYSLHFNVVLNLLVNSKK